MATKKKSKAKVSAKAEAAVLAADQPSVVIDPVIDPVIDDGSSDDTTDDVRLKAAIQQLGGVFDSIERRRRAGLERRRQAIQEMIDVAAINDVKAIVRRRDPAKVARLQDIVRESTARLAEVEAEGRTLAVEMARARQSIGVKPTRRRAVRK
jgi:hypothetical protein